MRDFGEAHYIEAGHDDGDNFSRSLCGICYPQECVQFGVDTACIPQPTNGTESFPMDSSHGFGVTHDRVWDGSTEDPTTGLCANGGRPNSEGRCITDFVPPKGLDPVAPIICPRYAEDGCCSWQQNYALYQNLQTLVDSFGSATGCLACAVNLVNFWCALICSPHQASFMSLHDPPFAKRDDDLTGGSSVVLQADVLVDSTTACAIYDSCKSVAIVGETTAMQSGLGLLKFQMQTGAVGHGEYFFLSFSNVTTPVYHGAPEDIVNGALDVGTKSDRWDASSYDAGSTGLSLEVLACDSFFDPGTSTLPFPYPPPATDVTTCRCDYCAQACSGAGGIDIDVSNDRPIPVMDGFRFGLVGCVYTAVAACSLALLWCQRYSLKTEDMQLRMYQRWHVEPM